MSTITPSRSALPSGVDPRRRPRRKPTMRRALILLVLSLFLPGTAQMAVGNKRIGRTVFAVYLACLASLGGLYAAGGRAEFLDLAVRPRVLLLLVVALAVAGIVWLSVILDAWRLGRPRRLKPRQRIWQAGLATVLCVVVAAPFAYAGRLAAVQHSFITTLFPSDDISGGSARIAQTGRLNILLIGADSGRTRSGLRPDSDNVVSLDLATGNAVIFGIPRNLSRFPFPKGTPAAQHFPDGFYPGTPGVGDDLWESLYQYAQDHPQLFPRQQGYDIKKPGLRAIREAAKATLGLSNLHYFVVINLQGFSDLVDALGGVTIRVAHPLPIGTIGPNGEHRSPRYTIQPGLHHFDGKHALAYARQRGGAANDFVRMGRQKCLMGGLLRQADPYTVITNYSGIAEASESLFDTNLPQGLLPDLAHVAGKAADARISQLNFGPPLIPDTAHPDISLIHRKVAQAIAGSTHPAPKSTAGHGSQQQKAHQHKKSHRQGENGGYLDAHGYPTTLDAIQGHAVSLSSTCKYR
jgi:LCP family protein required for cell wall assembly